MKHITSLLVIALILWMCSSSYYYVYNIKGYKNTPIVKTAIENKNIDSLIVSEKEIKKDSIPEIVEIENTIDDKTIYFEFKQNVFTPDEDFNSYITQLHTHLQEHSETSLLLIGHADTIGNEKINYLIGMKRAEFIKTTLINAGIENDRIETKSKGESEASLEVDTDNNDRKVEIVIINH